MIDFVSMSEANAFEKVDRSDYLEDQQHHEKYSRPQSSLVVSEQSFKRPTYIENSGKRSGQ